MIMLERRCISISQLSDDFIWDTAEELKKSHSELIDEVFQEIRKRGYYILEKAVNDKTLLAIEYDMQNRIEARKQNGN
jgi:sugar-specific transcriptional regulator TrmB